MEKLIIEIATFLEKHQWSKTVLLSLGLFSIFLLTKRIILKNIDKKEGKKQEKFLLRKKTSQYMNYFFALSILFLWFSQLQVFFVSLFAVAAAIVIALKELIMCVTGGMLIKMSHVFKIGDRIEIDGSRGFVIEKNLLTTKVLEIGPEKNSQQTTGDIITIPNSAMLTKSLKNESYFKGYSIKSLVFKIEDTSAIYEFEKDIANLAFDYTSKYIQEAKKSISSFCEKEGLIVPAVEPKTKIIVENGKEFSVMVKLPVINSQVGDIEQIFNRFYLDWKLKHS